MCLPHMSASYVCPICLPHMSASYVSLICQPYMSAQVIVKSSKPAAGALAPSIGGTVGKILREEGFLSLYKGCAPEVGRVCVFFIFCSCLSFCGKRASSLSTKDAPPEVYIYTYIHVYIYRLGGACCRRR